MGDNKSKHKKKKKRRHERQIMEGIRRPATIRPATIRRTTVRLSELDPEVVRKVLDKVNSIVV